MLPPSRVSEQPQVSIYTPADVVLSMWNLVFSVGQVRAIEEATEVDY